MMEPSISKNLSTERESVGSNHYLSNKRDENTELDSFFKVNDKSSKNLN